MNRIIDTNYHHVAVTKLGSRVVFYTDGRPNTPLNYNEVFQFTSNVALGSRGDNFTDSFLGHLDEIAVYNRPLSEIEVRAIFLAGSEGKCGAQTLKFPTPISWWPGEGNADDIISTNNGVLTGGTSFAGGIVGRAFSFNGTSAYVQVGERPALRFTDHITIEAWIYPTGPGSHPFAGGMIVNKEGEYEVARFTDGTIAWAFANTNPGWNWHLTSYVAPLNQWTHVAVVYDGGTVPLTATV